MKVQESLKIKIVGLLLLILSLVILSCSDPQTVSSESSASEQTISEVTFNITYGDEVTEQHGYIVGEEVVDGVDCMIGEFSFNPAASRISSDGKVAFKLHRGKMWIGKTIQEWLKAEYVGEVMDTNITTLVTNAFRINAPLSVGKFWFFDSTTRMIPELSPPSTERYRAEVVAQEEITVPAGTYSSYKITLSLVARDGIELENPVIDTVMWVNLDNYGEIKRETYTSWEKTEIAELVSVEE